MRIGVLGAGQLGRMLALAGIPLGLQFRFLDVAEDTPASQVAEAVVGSFSDEDDLRRLCQDCDVVTYEFENIPAAAVAKLAKTVSVLPPAQALAVSQDRLREKLQFKKLGIPTPAFVPIDSVDALGEGLRQVGYPAVLKTRRMGYDGKGQSLIASPETAYASREQTADQPMILEEFIAFDGEASILAVRSRAGEVAFYPLVWNQHRNGILRYSRPMHHAEQENDGFGLQQEAQDYATRLLLALDYVGVLAVEFFVVHGHLVANEMAPRVHNSGHWTIEGAETSQFENHLRAITGVPLGSTTQVGYCAMANLIGELPDLAEILAVEGAHLHVYGKSPRPGRKLGHVTFRARSQADLDAALAVAQTVIRPG